MLMNRAFSISLGNFSSSCMVCLRGPFWDLYCFPFICFPSPTFSKKINLTSLMRMIQFYLPVKLDTTVSFVLLS